MTLLLGAVVVVILVVIAEIAVGVHGHLPPGGYALVGVIAAIALVGVAKAAAALGLQRPPSDTGDR